MKPVNAPCQSLWSMSWQPTNHLTHAVMMRAVVVVVALFNWVALG